MCGDTVTHVLFPDKEIIDGARWAVVARHGHTFAVDKLVDMAAEEPDKPAAIEHFIMHGHGELVRASINDNAIHIFFSLRGGRADGSGPPVPLRGFRRTASPLRPIRAGNLTIQCFYPDDFFAKFVVFFGIVRIAHDSVYICD